MSFTSTWLSQTCHRRIVGSGKCVFWGDRTPTEMFWQARILHHVHVRAIVEAPAVKDDSGKELQCLHDGCSQYLRALKVMKCEPYEAFITSLTEMKVDESTMFERQRHSQNQPDMPHYMEILEFINLCARMSEITLCGGQKRHSLTVPSTKPMQAGSYVTSVPPARCVVQVSICYSPLRSSGCSFNKAAYGCSKDKQVVLQLFEVGSFPAAMYV